MSCIDMPEVAYLYGYLLVSARVYTSDCTPTSCRSGARDSLSPHRTGFLLACSELYKPKYNLKKTDPRGEDEESLVYYTHLHSDAVPTLKTLIVFGPDPENLVPRVHPLGFGLWAC